MSSYEKINYTLRPCKQIERKILVESILKLSRIGYYIQDYIYLGMGSIYYMDFLLFHKYLMIDKMICVERDDIYERMHFNKPYEFIELYTGESIGEIAIQKLKRDEKYFFWLDFDSFLDEKILDDINSCIQILASGSILLISIPIKKQNLYKDSQSFQFDKTKLEFLENFLTRPIDTKIDLKYKDIHKVFYLCLRNIINDKLSIKDDLQFHPLFNFRYADGTDMLTIGGIIDHKDAGKKIYDAGIYKEKYFSQNENAVLITAPPLTHKERMCLERSIPNHLEACSRIGIKETMGCDFAEYYKYYPSYHEGLL